jgi:hypothetical protein
MLLEGRSCAAAEFAAQPAACTFGASCMHDSSPGLSARLLLVFRQEMLARRGEQQYERVINQSITYNHPAGKAA